MCVCVWAHTCAHTQSRAEGIWGWKGVSPLSLFYKIYFFQTGCYNPPALDDHLIWWVANTAFISVLPIYTFLYVILEWVSEKIFPFKLFFKIANITKPDNPIPPLFTLPPFQLETFC